MPRAPCLHSWGWWSDCKEPSFSTATFTCAQQWCKLSCYYYSWISFFSFPFQFRASDKIAKRKKAGCSCKTPGLLMRRTLSIPDLSGQHRTSLPTSPLPPQQAGGILGAILAPVFWLQPPVICNVYSVRFHLSGDFIVCWKVWLCPSWK